MQTLSVQTVLFSMKATNEKNKTIENKPDKSS